MKVLQVIGLSLTDRQLFSDNFFNITVVIIIQQIHCVNVISVLYF